MLARARRSTAFLLALFVAGPVAAAPTGTRSAADREALPWREAGLTEREAAAHLLDRFAYGSRPGDVDAVVEQGIENWLEQQLDAAVPDPDLASRLAPLDAFELSAEEIVETFPNPGIVLRRAMESGRLSSMGDDDDDAGDPGDPRRDPQLRREAMRLLREEGYRPQRELLEQLAAHKLLRAVYSENQLAEVMTDFWFNHFNVSVTDPQVRVSVLAYERDALRPHVLGSFPDLLTATAGHPAMLAYLDNAASRAEPERTTLLELRRGELASRRGPGGGGPRAGAGTRQRSPAESSPAALRRPTGLNENYARELLELHTLGVDGGYDQEDVIEVARAFTGWTILPPAAREEQRERLARARRFDVGVVVDGMFLFNPEAHDAEAKTVLGRPLPAGRGIEDGLEVLDLLASHPSTARHVSHKIAVRFVSDEPPTALVERLADTFRASGGDVAELLRTLVRSPEFWSEEARLDKIKSPFEVAVSALRALDAEVEDPRAVLQWVERMGQPLYRYEAPTGFPDRASAWVSTGALLTRMNFALELATSQLPGVELDLGALADGREPESLDRALELYAALLLPERDLAATLEQLRPMLAEPALAERVAEADRSVEPLPFEDEGEELEVAATSSDPPRGPGGRRSAPLRRRPPDPSPLAQVVGVILGSPEFQRR